MYTRRMPEQFLFYQREGFTIQCEGLDEATGEKRVHHAMETKIEIGSCRGEVMKRAELESDI